MYTQWAKIIFTGFLIVSECMRATTIGKPREPLEVSDIAIGMFLSTLIIMYVWWPK